MDTENIDVGGSGFIKGQLREIEIRFDPCVNPVNRTGFCANDQDFGQWFDNKVFYMWSSGNYLVPGNEIQSDESLKQRMVYQLALNTTFGVQSHVYYEMNMAEVKLKHAGD